MSREEKARNINGWSLQGDKLVAHRNRIVLTVTRDRPVPAQEKRQEIQRRALLEANSSGHEVAINHNPLASRMEGQAILVRVMERGKPVIVSRMKPNGHGGPEMDLAQIAASITPQALISNIVASQALMQRLGQVKPNEER